MHEINSLAIICMREREREKEREKTDKDIYYIRRIFQNAIAISFIYELFD